MSASACSRLGVLMGLLAACGQPAEYRFGENVSGLRFAPVSPSEGVFPSPAVLFDPANPFRTDQFNLRLQPDGGVGTKWALLSSVGGVPAFYAFATALANEPTGENQFYSAQTLGQIALTGAYADSTTREKVTAMAVAGYQSMLDNFPNAVTYDATGKTAFPLATQAYTSAVALGGTIVGWSLVTSADGTPVAVRNGSFTLPDGGH
jgi:hypothetical protein